MLALKHEFENGVRRLKLLKLVSVLGFIVALSGFLCLMTGIVGALNAERVFKTLTPGFFTKTGFGGLLVGIVFLVLRMFAYGSLKSRLFPKMFEVIDSPFEHGAEFPSNVEDPLGRFLPNYNVFRVDDCITKDGHVFAEIEFLYDDGSSASTRAGGPVFVVKRHVGRPCTLVPDLDAHVGDSIWHSFIASTLNGSPSAHFHKMNEYLIDKPESKTFLSNLLTATDFTLKACGNVYVIAERERIIVFVNDHLTRANKASKNRFDLGHIHLAQLDFDGALESLREDIAYVASVFDILALHDFESEA